jgi:hypothetical protein
MISGNIQRFPEIDINYLTKWNWAFTVLISL